MTHPAMLRTGAFARSTSLLRFPASLDAVGHLVDDLELDNAASLGEIVIRREPSHMVLRLEGSPALTELEHFVRAGMQTLHDAALASGAVVTSSLGASYPVQSEDDRQDVTLYVAIAAPVLVPDDALAAGVRIDDLPSCTVGVLEHPGPNSGT